MKTKTKFFIQFLIILFFSFLGTSDVSASTTSSYYAGTGSTGYFGDDSPLSSGTEWTFNGMTYSVLAPNGTRYIADTDNHCIRQISATGVLSTLTGLCGTPGYFEGTGSNARYNLPTGIAIDGTTDILYIADSGNNVIRKFVISTNETYMGNPFPQKMSYLLAGQPGSTGGYAEGIGSAAQFNHPEGIAINSTNTILYVADRDNHVIRKIDLINKATTVVVGQGGILGDIDGIGSSARLNSPWTVIINSASTTLFIADTGNSKIKRVTLSDSNLTTLAGSSSGYQEGVGVIAKLNAPKALVHDVYNNALYISDTGNHTLRKLDLSNNLTTLLIGSGGVSGYYGDDNPAVTDGQVLINSPMGLQWDSINNKLYYIDSGNGRIRMANVNSFQTLQSPSVYIESQDTLADITVGQTMSTPYIKARFAFMESAFPNTEKADLEVAEVGTAFSVTGASAFTLNFTITGSTNQNRSLYLGEPYVQFGKSYHMRWRLTNSSGATTDWINWGSNDESAADFAIGLAKNNSVSTIFTNTAGEAFTGANSTSNGPNTAPLVYDSRNGNLYIFRNSCIQKIIPSGTISTLAGICGTNTGHNLGVSGTGGLSTTFTQVAGLALDETRNFLYISETGVKQIKKLDLSTNIVTVVAGLYNMVGDVNGANLTSQFADNGGITLDVARNILYVAELSSGNLNVRAVNLVSGMTSGYSYFILNYGGYTGPGMAKITYDSDRNLVYAAYCDGILWSGYFYYTNIYKFNPSSSVFTKLMSYTDIRDGFSDGSLNTARFRSIHGMVFDNKTNGLFITDGYSSWCDVSPYSCQNIRSYNRVRKIDLNLQEVSSIVGDFNPIGMPPFREGIGTNALFLYPDGITIDLINRKLYVFDTGNSKIRKVDIKSYETPTASQLKLYNRNTGTVITSTGTTTMDSPLFGFQATVADNDAVDSVAMDVGVQEGSGTFTGTGYMTMGIPTVSGTSIAKTLEIGKPYLSDGKSYYIYYRLTDTDSNTTGWKRYSTGSLPEIAITTPKNGKTSSIPNSTANLGAGIRNMVRHSDGTLYLVDVATSTTTFYIWKINPNDPSKRTLFATYLSPTSSTTHQSSMVLDETHNRLLFDIYYQTDWSGQALVAFDLTTGQLTNTYFLGQFNNNGNGQIIFDESQNVIYGLESGMNYAYCGVPTMYLKVWKYDLNSQIRTLLRTFNQSGPAHCVNGNYPGYIRGYLDPISKKLQFISIDPGNQFTLGSQYLIYDPATDIAGPWQTIVGSPVGTVNTSYDTNNRVFFLGNSNGSVYTFDPNSLAISRVIGNGSSLGYQEGIGSTALFQSIGDITYDNLSKTLYVLDSTNGRIRTVDTKNYTPPATPSNLKISEVDNISALTFPAVLKQKAVVVGFSLSSTDAMNSGYAEIEVKPVGQNFDGSGTIKTSNYSFSNAGTLVSFVLGGTSLEWGTNYHLRIRAANSLGLSSWEHLATNNDIGKGDTSNDVDFTTPVNYTNTGYQTVYLGGAGTIPFVTGTGSIGTFGLANTFFGSISRLKKTLDGKLLFLADGNLYRYDPTSDSLEFLLMGSTITAYTFDPTNNILYYADGTSIRKISGFGTVSQASAIWITGAAGDAIGFPTDTKFSGISAIELSSNGQYLYIADAGNSKLKKLGLGDGNFITTLVKDTLSGLLSLKSSPDGSSLYVGKSSELARLNIADNSLAVIAGDGSHAYITMDDLGKYVFSSNMFTKYAYSESIAGSISIMQNGSYAEGISTATSSPAQYTSSIDGLEFMSNRIYFVDQAKRIRSIRIPAGSELATSGLSKIVLNREQRESNNSAASVISPASQSLSQTVYIKTDISHDYLYQHIRPEIEIKQVNQSFDGTNVIYGPYAFYDTVGVNKTVSTLITKDTLQPSTQYKWRARITDIYGSKSLVWVDGPVGAGGTSFQTPSIGIGQTNLIMGVMNPSDATGKYPLVTLPTFNNHAVERDTGTNQIKKIYFVDKTTTPACLKYFDYQNYKDKYLTEFIKTVACDASFDNVSGKIVRRTRAGSINRLFYHDATAIYRIDLSNVNPLSTIITFAGSPTIGTVDSDPINTRFSSINDIVFMRDVNPFYDELCMLVTDQQATKKIRIVPMETDERRFSCTPIGGTNPEGITKDWSSDPSIQDLDSALCLNESNVSPYVQLYTKNGIINKFSGAFTGSLNGTPLNGLPCLNETRDLADAYVYSYDSTDLKIYKVPLSNPLGKIWVAGGGNAIGAGYMEAYKEQSKFQSTSAAFFLDDTNNILVVNDSGKLREVQLNSVNAPVMLGINPIEGVVGDTVTLSGSFFGNVPSGSRNNGINYILVNGLSLQESDVFTWTENSIQIRIPAGATTGEIRVKTANGVSNGLVFTVKNLPIILANGGITPSRGKAGDTVIIEGLYFGIQGASSKIIFSGNLGTLIEAQVVGWSTNRIAVVIPNGAKTGNVWVQTLYGQSNPTLFEVFVSTPPDTPSASSPINNEITPKTPTLTASGFVGYGGNTHAASWWQIRQMSNLNTLLSPGWNTIDLESVLLGTAVGLKNDTTYEWRVKYKDAAGNVSDWSNWAQFTVEPMSGAANLTPVKPDIVTINSQSVGTVVTGLSLTGQLLVISNNYKDGETFLSITGATVHTASYWKIIQSGTNQLVTDSTITSGNLEQLDIPNLGALNKFLPDTEYCVLVKYKDALEYGPFSNMTCFRTKQSVTGVTGNGTGGGGGAGGSLSDVPNAPDGFSIANNSGSHLVSVISNAYIDSNTDTLIGANDKLQAVEWQILLFSGSTGIGLSTNGSGFVTDPKISSVSFGASKKFRELRENCSNDTCILSKIVSYNDLGATGTFLIRVRHMDQYSMWGDFSSVKAFEVTSLPNLSQYLGTLRSIANLSVKTISGDSAPFSYSWTGTTQSGIGNIIPIVGGNCGTQPIPASYSIYSYCLFDSGTSTVFGYASGNKSDSLKFEPIKKGLYNFTVTVTNPTTTKNLSKIIPVIVQ